MILFISMIIYFLLKKCYPEVLLLKKGKKEEEKSPYKVHSYLGYTEEYGNYPYPYQEQYPSYNYLEISKNNIRKQALISHCKTYGPMSKKLLDLDIENNM